MNKYTKLSDFEINKKVAERLFLKFTDCFSVVLFEGESFDPCNNPADAMPIIIGNLISLMADMSEDGESAWWLAQDVTVNITSEFKSNPLRAAMEVYLLMKDAENEKV